MFVRCNYLFKENIVIHIIIDNLMSIMEKAIV